MRRRTSIEEAGVEDRQVRHRLEALPRGFSRLRVAREVRSVGEHREDRQPICVAIDVANRGRVDRGEFCTRFGQPARPREAVGVPRARVSSIDGIGQSIGASARTLVGPARRSKTPSMPISKSAPVAGSNSASSAAAANCVRVHPGSRPIARNAGAKHTHVRRVSTSRPGHRNKMPHTRADRARHMRPGCRLRVLAHERRWGPPIDSTAPRAGQPRATSSSTHFRCCSRRWGSQTTTQRA